MDGRTSIALGAGLVAVGVALACGGEAPSEPATVFFTPDGKGVILDRLSRVDAATGSRGGYAGGILSPDGQRTAGIRDGRLAVDGAGTNTFLLLPPAISHVLAWSDERTLYVSSADAVDPTCATYDVLSEVWTKPPTCLEPVNEIQWIILGKDHAVVRRRFSDGRETVRMTTWPEGGLIAEYEVGEAAFEAMTMPNGAIHLLTSCHLDAEVPCDRPDGRRRYRLTPYGPDLLAEHLPSGAMPSPVDDRYAWEKGIDGVCVGELGETPTCFPAPPPPERTN